MRKTLLYIWNKPTTLFIRFPPLKIEYLSLVFTVEMITMDRLKMIAQLKHSILSGTFLWRKIKGVLYIVFVESSDSAFLQFKAEYSHLMKMKSSRETMLDCKLLALNSPTSGGRSVGIVRWRTKPRSFFYRLWIWYTMFSTRSSILY
jgi:hypothetical protein